MVRIFAKILWISIELYKNIKNIFKKNIKENKISKFLNIFMIYCNQGYYMPNYSAFINAFDKMKIKYKIKYTLKKLNIVQSNILLSHIYFQNELKNNKSLYYSEKNITEYNKIGLYKRKYKRMYYYLFFRKKWIKYENSIIFFILKK